MSWQAALVFFYLTCVGQALIQRTYSQTSKLPESFPPALSYLLGVTPLGIIVGLSISHDIQWSGWLVFLLIVEGIFIGLYNWLSFMAIRRLSLARFQMIYQVCVIVTVALGWLLLDEKLTFIQLVGASLLLVAALLAIRAPEPTRTERARPIRMTAVGLALLSAIVMGIGLVTEKAALQYMDIGAYFIFGYSAQTVALLIFAAKDFKRENFAAIRPHDYGRIITMGILSASVGFFYISAIVNADNISFITSLTTFSVPLIVLAGYFLLHERDNLKLLWTATLLGSAGLIISTLH